MSDIPNNMRIALAVSDFLEGGEIIKIEVDGEWHSVKMIEFRANGVIETGGRGRENPVPSGRG